MRLLAAVQEQRETPAKCFKRAAWNAGAQANYVQLCPNPGPNFIPNPLIPALCIFGPEFPEDGARYFPKQADYDATDWVVSFAPV